MRVSNHRHDLDLVRNPAKRVQHVIVALDKSKFGIDKALLACKLLDEHTCLLEVVSREAGEEVVRDLEVEAAVDEAEGVRADDVDGCAELAVDEGFDGPEVGC